jgi:tetratricopeptide (TPR) repeat protein
MTFQPLRAVVVACALASTAALAQLAIAQGTSDTRRLFEMGRYQEIVEATGPDAQPSAMYAAGQSHQKLGANDQALTMYGRLVKLPENDAWHFIGLAATQLLEGDHGASLESAQRAVQMDGSMAEAHYQLGLALARREAWNEAAAAFDRTAEIEPAHAYAHYYGGLMHYRAGRTDRMAVHFEQFLRLAPEAPERPEVMQIMRTIRGR